MCECEGRWKCLYHWMRRHFRWWTMTDEQYALELEGWANQPRPASHSPSSVPPSGAE